MKAKSIKGKSPEEIQSALQQSMSDGFKPTLAIVFISIKQNIQSVCDILNEQDISIFGATSCGEFIDGEISEGEIAMLLLDMKQNNFHILIEPYQGRDIKELTKAMGTEALKHFKNPSFLVSTSMNLKKQIKGREIIHGLESAIGADLNIWGGNAGDDRIFENTLVFTNQQCVEQGIILLVIDADKVMMKGQAAFGWKPVGTERTITKCDKGLIYSIDNQSALDVVFKFLGLQLTKEEAEKFKPGNVVLCISREAGNPVMRASGYFNWNERYFSVNGDVEEGDKFRFALPPDFDIVEKVANDAREIKDKEFSDAEALVMFSCVGRQDELGPMIEAEIDGVKDSFKVPMAGFFSYGEFGRATNGKNEFHNSTCCWVALKENKSIT